MTHFALRVERRLFWPTLLWGQNQDTLVFVLEKFGEVCETRDQPPGKILIEEKLHRATC